MLKNILKFGFDAAQENADATIDAVTDVAEASAPFWNKDIKLAAAGVAALAAGTGAMYWISKRNKRPAAKAAPQATPAANVKPADQATEASEATAEVTPSTLDQHEANMREMIAKFEELLKSNSAGATA